MPNFDLRKIVMDNLSSSNAQEIQEHIEDTIKTREEAALPGLGILFEAVWKTSDVDFRKGMMDRIMQEVQKAPVS